MAQLISAICCTLVILAFCQIIVEAVLPEGGTRRFVVFLTGLVSVAVITAALSAGTKNFAQTVFFKTQVFRTFSTVKQAEVTQGSNAYQEYIERIIQQWK
jgi:hypothetical protein